MKFKLKVKHQKGKPDEYLPQLIEEDEKFTTEYNLILMNVGDGLVMKQHAEWKVENCNWHKTRTRAIDVCRKWIAQQAPESPDTEYSYEDISL